MNTHNHNHNTHVVSHSSSKKSNRRRVCLSFATGIALAFAAAGPTYAQVSTINSVVVQPHILYNLTNAVLTVVTNYPTLVSFTETNAQTTNTAFSPNQDLWQFAVKGQTSGYVFQSDSFTVSMTVTLTGSPLNPRKEAGFAFNDVSGNINGQYILDLDGQEVVAFGGNLPFYATPLDHFYLPGEPIIMGITILTDVNGKQSIIYSAGGFSSAPLEFGSPQTNYTLGGYFQIQGQGTTNNQGSATFANISITQLATGLGIAGTTGLGIPGASSSSVAVYWPASASSYVLQSATNVTSTNWTTVTTGVPITGVVLPATLPASFYRLQAP